MSHFWREVGYWSIVATWLAAFGLVAFGFKEAGVVTLLVGCVGAFALVAAIHGFPGS